MATAQAEIVIAKLEGFVVSLVRKIVLDMHANLVRPGSDGGTPVDTGFARANWIPRLGEPGSAPVGARPTEPGPSPSGKALFVDTGAAEAGKAAVATGFKLGAGDVYVSNHVPYIGHLNNGSSKQAPAGFVQRAITKALVEDINR